MPIVREREYLYSPPEAVKQLEKRFALNARNWQLQEGESFRTHRDRVVRDLASAILEMGATVEERTNPIVIPISEFEALAQNSRKFQNDTSVDRAENSATDRLLQSLENTPARFGIETAVQKADIAEEKIIESLASFWQMTNLNIPEMVIWVSPPSSERGVKENPEARFNLYIKLLVNGKPHCLILPVCGNQTVSQCLTISHDLLSVSNNTNSETPLTENELRNYPLSLKFQNRNIWRVLGQAMDMQEAFEAIAEGACFKRKLAAYQIAKDIYQRNYQKLLDARDFNDFFHVGIQIERSILQAGVRTNISACGFSYLDSLSNNFLANQLTAWNAISGKFPSINSGGENGKFIHNCGACGKELKRFMTKGDKCPYCQGTYEGC